MDRRRLLAGTLGLPGLKLRRLTDTLILPGAGATLSQQLAPEWRTELHSSTHSKRPRHFARRWPAHREP